MATFEELKLTRQFINAVEELGFTEPTEVQAKCIPPVLSGQQVIGVAPTGTGKTAAYGLPLLQTLKYAQGENPRALVIVPTKELVLQVVEKLEQLSKFTDLRIVGVYGGVGPKEQIDKIAQGVDVVVGTPGRFLEIYLKGKLVTKQLKHLVLDEADKIMDMGFMPQLRNILEVVPRKRQNLLFSATFGPKVDQLSEEFLDFPLKIEVSPSATTLVKVSQVKIELPNLLTKLNYLKELLKDPEMERVIVFAKKRTSATAIYNTLIKENIGELRIIHANKGQNFRINSYKEFQEGNVRILVATDVAARGIDIVDVSHVVNFDVPMRYEDYVHRIGRTGRAGKSGISITFVQPDDVWHIRKIEALINQPIPEQKLPKHIERGDYIEGEKQQILREVDRRKQMEDPTFQGAFHEKKRVLIAKGLMQGDGKKKREAKAKRRRDRNK